MDTKHSSDAWIALARSVSDAFATSRTIVLDARCTFPVPERGRGMGELRTSDAGEPDSLGQRVYLLGTHRSAGHDIIIVFDVL